MGRLPNRAPGLVGLRLERNRGWPLPVPQALPIEEWNGYRVSGDALVALGPTVEGGTPALRW